MGPETNVITGGFFNLLKIFFFIGDASLAKTYNNLPQKEEGDKDIRDYFEKEPSIAGLIPNTEVKMDHKNIGKLS